MRWIKRTAGVVAFGILFMGMFGIQTKAQTTPGFKGSENTGIWYYGTPNEVVSYGVPGFKNSDEVKLTSSNKKVLIAETDEKNDPYTKGGVRWFTNIINKTGNVKVTCTVNRGNKTYVTKKNYLIKSYTNPVKSFKIDGKELNREFSKKEVLSNSYLDKKKVTGKKKISFTPDKEFKLDSIVAYAGKSSKTVKNNETVDLSKVKYLVFWINDKKNPQYKFNVVWVNGTY